jgi:hypothetical protein
VKSQVKRKWPDWGLNPGPPGNIPGALTTELPGLSYRVLASHISTLWQIAYPDNNMCWLWTCAHHAYAIQHNNVCIKKGDEWKGAFKTSKWLFELTVMFFGLINSPATFQMMMDDIFQEDVAQGWLKIYMDNMIIATEDDDEEHEWKVAHVLQKLLNHDLFLKPEKCQFHKKEVKYLGVIIGGGKVMMDPIKVKGITKWPTPNTVKEVQSFLGFCNFYWPFILNFSGITWPLNDLTKKN